MQIHLYKPLFFAPLAVESFYAQGMAILEAADASSRFWACFFSPVSVVTLAATIEVSKAATRAWADQISKSVPTEKKEGKAERETLSDGAANGYEAAA